MLDAVVVQADGVEHARGRLDGARRGVAGARLPRDGLGDDAAELAEIDRAGHCAGVAEGARGDEDGVAQLEAAEGDGQVSHDTASAWGQSWSGSPSRIFRTNSTISFPP